MTDIIRKSMGALVTRTCDSKCVHCYNNSVSAGETTDIEVAVWKKVMRDFRDRGGSDVCIHGGEPLLYYGIKELLLETAELGLEVSLITNGLHLDDSIVDILRETGAYVLMSLDGPRENYCRFRGVDGLETVVANVRKLLNAGVPVHPIHVVHRHNVHDLSWIVGFCSENGIATATLSPIQPIGRASVLADYLLTPAELHDLIDQINELNIKSATTRYVSQAVYRPADVERYQAGEQGLKSYNDGFYYVLNDGTIVADLDLPDSRRYSIGDFRHLGRIDAAAHSRYRALLDRAYLRGLSELQCGRAINWNEVVQREAAEFGA